MSVASIIAQLKATLARVDVDGSGGRLPRVAEDGVLEPIPDEVHTRGTYIEVEFEEFDYGYVGQQAVDDPTSSIGSFIVLIVMNQQVDLPSGENWIDFLPAVARLIRRQMEQDTRDNLYANAGDGFAATLRRVDYHQRPNDPTAACKLTIQATAYV